LSTSTTNPKLSNMRTPNTFNHTTVQNDHTFDIIRESYIALGAKRI